MTWEPSLIHKERLIRVVDGLWCLDSTTIVQFWVGSRGSGFGLAPSRHRVGFIGLSNFIFNLCKISRLLIPLLIFFNFIFFKFENPSFHGVTNI